MEDPAAWKGRQAALSALLGAALAACGTVDRGTFQPASWAAMDLRPATTRRGLVTRVGEVTVIEGDATLISGIGDELGIRFDMDRNDLAAVTARFATEAVDRPALLMLFTTFDDRGAGGPAYHVPLWTDAPGTGRTPVDQRASFGVTSLVGVVNMKRRSAHETLALDAAHEIAHQHLVFFPPVRAGTIAIDLLGVQAAHWHALVASEASLMGGHAFRETAPGRFVVTARYARFSTLDLYGLGLLDPDDVAPFFFIHEGRTEAGAPIPQGAQLSPGTPVRGIRADLAIEDVVTAAGPRRLESPQVDLLFALVTRPDESSTSTSATAEAEAIDALRAEIEDVWVDLTGGRGRLCTKTDGCAPLPSDAGAADTGVSESNEKCGCVSLDAQEEAGRGSILAPALLFVFAFLRCRGRERSSCRSNPHDPPHHRAASPLSD